ncbi:MAG: prepilin-type N-terminal cleavage/methylation domain-containing protein [Thermodesulfobacteriota bacterium]
MRQRCARQEDRARSSPGGRPATGAAGFTLLEIVAVLVLLALLAAVAVPKYLDLTEEAKLRALDEAVAQLNSRENLTWSSYKLTDTATWDDSVLQARMTTALGDHYTWTGNDVSFEGGPARTFNRQASTAQAPARWTRSP